MFIAFLSLFFVFIYCSLQYAKTVSFSCFFPWGAPAEQKRLKKSWFSVFPRHWAYMQTSSQRRMIGWYSWSAGWIILLVGWAGGWLTPSPPPAAVFFLCFVCVAFVCCFCCCVLLVCLFLFLVVCFCSLLFIRVLLLFFYTCHRFVNEICIKNPLQSPMFVGLSAGNVCLLFLLCLCCCRCCSFSCCCFVCFCFCCFCYISCCFLCLFLFVCFLYRFYFAFRAFVLIRCCLFDLCRFFTIVTDLSTQSAVSNHYSPRCSSFLDSKSRPFGRTYLFFIFVFLCFVVWFSFLTCFCV